MVRFSQSTAATRAGFINYVLKEHGFAGCEKKLASRKGTGLSPYIIEVEL